MRMFVVMTAVGLPSTIMVMPTAAQTTPLIASAQVNADQTTLTITELNLLPPPSEIPLTGISTTSTDRQTGVDPVDRDGVVGVVGNGHTPAALAAGTYPLGRARNDQKMAVFHLTIGEIGPAGSPGPAGVAVADSVPGPAGPVGLAGPAVSMTTGAQNTAFGETALSSLTTGERNSAFGYEALTSLTTGTRELAFGYEVLTSLGAGGDDTCEDRNTAVGNRTRESLTEGEDSVALGARALGRNDERGRQHGVRLPHAGQPGDRERQHRGRFSVVDRVDCGRPEDEHRLRGADPEHGRHERHCPCLPAGKVNTTGSNNTYIEHAGAAADESGRIRIGTAATHTETHLANTMHATDFVAAGSGLCNLPSQGIQGLAGRLGRLGRSDRRVCRPRSDRGVARPGRLDHRRRRGNGVWESVDPLVRGWMAAHYLDGLPGFGTIRYEVFAWRDANARKEIRDDGNNAAITLIEIAR